MAKFNRVLWQDGVGVPGAIRERPVTQKLLVVSSNPVAPEDVPAGVEAKFTFGSGIGPEAFAETLPATFGGYLTEALTKGVYKIAPPPHNVNSKGLDGIQEALDVLKAGVSASKLVVERP